MTVDREGRAWRWLLEMERLPWDDSLPGAANRQRHEGQVRVRMSPGKLYESQGAPLVHVSVAHHGLNQRVSAYGNSLADAVERLHGELCHAGVRMPFIDWYTE